MKSTAAARRKSQSRADTRRLWGVNLREARTKAGLSQAELANLIGVAQTAVSQYELGATSPVPQIQSRLAKVLGKKAHLLFPLPDESPTAFA